MSNDEIAEFVESNGAVADRVVVYNTLPNDSIDEKIKSEIRNAEFDLIIFYSPSQVKSFINIFGVEILKDKQIAVIGPTTKKAVEHHGLHVTIVPENSTTENLVESLYKLDYQPMNSKYKIKNDLILRVLRNEPAERTPIWIMRQAGRYLPEYMTVRANHDFLTMCKTPELSAGNYNPAR